MPIVLKCLPLSMKMKRYYWRKYCIIKACNGAEYAAEVFKELKEILLLYVADNHRIANREKYMKRCRVRKNAMLKMLFAYADTSPHRVIQFLKLYCSETKPVVKKELAAEKQTKILLEADGNVPNPEEMITWCEFITTPIPNVIKVLRILSSYGDGRYHTAFSELCESGSYLLGDEWQVCSKNLVQYLLQLLENYSSNEIIAYLVKWKKIFIPKKQFRYDDCVAKVTSKFPTRYSYADTEYGVNRSEMDAKDDFDNYDNDLLVFKHAMDYFFQHRLFEDAAWTLWELGFGDPDCAPIVGEIQQIPKKGTVTWRSIAAPNRFLQAGLYPMRDFLRIIARKIPGNCQFDQDKLDGKIYAELMKGNASCVDLSQATDWLPLGWFDCIYTWFKELWFGNYPIRESGFAESKVLEDSFQLFHQMAEGSWDNSGTICSWRRGQPLGTLPSFEVLTLTHSVLIESICFSLGNLESPYGVLGDDSVFFLHEARERYIAIMEEAGSPLSLHKSYDGRIVEFAGKYYIRNNGWMYAPSPGALYLTNLFDYQRCAKLNIKFNDLPHSLRKKLVKAVMTNLDRDIFDISLECSEEYARNIYKAMQLCCDVPLTHVRKRTGELVALFLNRDVQEHIDDKLIHVAEKSRYFKTVIDFGQTIPTTAQGKLRKKRSTERWYRMKVRPHSTMDLISLMAKAINRTYHWRKVFAYAHNSGAI